jgi:quaternary ammonium compound-resistance protein SugE
MAWLVLTLAGAFEIVWPIATKYSDGFHRPLPGRCGGNCDGR